GGDVIAGGFGDASARGGLHPVRCQPGGALVKSRRHPGDATRGGTRGSILQLRGDLLVGLVDAEREVMGTLVRISGRRGEPAMRRAALRWKRGAVGDGREQRMREPEPAAVEVEDAGLDRFGESLAAPSGGTLDELRARVLRGGGEHDG